MAPGPWTRRVAALAALATLAAAAEDPVAFDVSCSGSSLVLAVDSTTMTASCDGQVSRAPQQLTADNNFAVAVSLSGLENNLQLSFGDNLGALRSLEIVKQSPDHAAIIDLEYEFSANFYALSLDGINFTSNNVSLDVGPKFNYLSISNSNLVNISTANNVSKLTLELKDELTTIPGILYQTNYTDLNLPSLNFDLTNEVALTSLQYYTLEANVGDTNLSTAGVTCSISNGSGTCSATSSSNSGVIDNIFPPTSSTDDNKKSSSSSSSSGSTSTEAGNDDGDGGLSTVLIVVIVIIVVIALALLFFIVRHLRSRRAANSGNNGDDNMATLMSKDDTPAGNIKGSFISNDEFLRTFRIDQSDVSLTKALGTGGLWMGEYQGNKVAIKRIEAEVTSTSVAKQFREQARMFATLSHPNIVSLIGVTWLAGTDFAVVAEFLAKGNLKTLLSNMDIDLDLMAKLQICLDVAQGLAYLHSRERNMCIKALSSRKVLLTSSTECKLNLFDCVSTSVKLDNNVSYPYGTGEIGWLAPEVLTRSVHMDPRKANIFSFGVLVCEVLTRATPYQALIDERGNTLSDVEILKRAKNREQLTPHEGRIEFASAPLSLRQIVNECLSYDAVRRPTADELVVAVQRAQEEARTKSI